MKKSKNAETQVYMKNGSKPKKVFFLKSWLRSMSTVVGKYLKIKYFPNK